MSHDEAKRVAAIVKDLMLGKHPAAAPAAAAPAQAAPLPPPPSAPPAGPPPPPPPADLTAAWKPDPVGRNEYRYWNGSAWTADVSNQGTQSTDPV